MSNFIQQLTQFFSFDAHPTQDRDDRYLAEAADIYDLERRMRELDSGRNGFYALSSHGVVTR
ncbi:MAG: DUF3563 family protein [Proteobacteria bacterium]|nr:DUF3563 family protein [Pseudomonadota bacterium]